MIGSCGRLSTAIGNYHPEMADANVTILRLNRRIGPAAKFE